MKTVNTTAMAQAASPWTPSRCSMSPASSRDRVGPDTAGDVAADAETIRATKIR